MTKIEIEEIDDIDDDDIGARTEVAVHPIRGIGYGAGSGRGLTRHAARESEERGGGGGGGDEVASRGRVSEGTARR